VEEKTLILLKPDAVDRRLAGTIISRYENKGLRIAAMKMIKVPQETAEKNYAEHRGKPFFQILIDFMTGGPVVAMVLSGQDAIHIARTLNGATNPINADPGSIRGDLAKSKQYNLVHASDSPASAVREIGIFFNQNEILDYTLTQNKWYEE